MADLAGRATWSHEAMTAGLLCGLGGWLLLPWETLTSVPSYAAWRSIAPEPVSGALLLILGLVQLVALWRGGLHARAGCAVAAAGLWAFLAGLFGLGNPAGLGVPLFGLLAVGSAAVYVRLEWERRWTR